MSETREQERGFLPAARFKALTPYFDAFVRLPVREKAFRRRLLDWISLPPGAEVLDLGVGTATVSIALKQRHPDANIVGVDADPDILEVARRKTAEAGVQVELREAFSQDLPFPDASFDAVVSTLVFHHLKPDVKRATLVEIGRVLKPGGRLYVGDWGKPADPLQAALFLQSRIYDGFDVTRDNGKGRLPQMFEDAGLSDARVDGRMRTPFGTLAFYRASAPDG